MDNNNVNNNNTQSIQQLQQKIRSQASRLCSLQQYISLCESHLLHYNPQLKLPLTTAPSLSKTPPSNPAQKLNELQSKYKALQLKYNSLYESTSRIQKFKPPYNKNNNNTSSLEIGDNPLKTIEQLSSLERENQALKNEKQNLIASLKHEMVTNDEQRNYIEILKQAIESSLINSGLKDKLDLIKSQYYSDLPKDDYGKVILDIMSMKTKNDLLTKQVNEYVNQIDKNKNQIKTLSLEVQKLHNVNQENTSLKSKCDEMQKHIECIENENNNLKQTTIQQDDNLKSIQNELNTIYQEKEQIINENKDIQEHNSIIANENKELQSYINNLSTQCSNLNNQITHLKQYESKFHILSKENNDIKSINVNLSHDYNLLQNENDQLKQNLVDLTAVRNNNIVLQQDINELNSRLTATISAKAQNEAELLNSLDRMKQEKEFAENLLCEYRVNNNNQKSGNKRCNDLLQEIEYCKFEINKLKEENVKCHNDCGFYIGVINRLLMFHVGCLNVTNLVKEMVQLNERKGMLEIQMKECGNNVNERDVEKELVIKKQIDNAKQKICCLDQQLKAYETVMNG
jgi:chromosome segregation ATPase